MMALRHRCCDVYVASDGTGRHKVGITGNLTLRMYHLSRKVRRPVTAVHVEPMVENAEAVEIAAHWALVDHHDHSEWFTVPALQAVAAVRLGMEQIARGELPASRPVINQRRNLGERYERGIAANLLPAETRLDLIRQALDRELKRRERQKG